ncbi:MAG: HlyD family efflux transporter periplasmic adaptor subunit [Spirochaetaceae bacterium]|nr:MAG: HlyD family efflux transporter periplasmic adaptor subunit [Spirochaetaceae bacterium]
MGLFMKKLLIGLIMIFVSFGAFAQTGGFGGGTPPAGGAGGAGGAFGGSPGGATARTEREPTEAIGVVEPGERVFTTTVGGRLRPVNTVSHPATATGIVSAVHVSVGRTVAAGEALFTVDRDDVAGSFAPVVIRARIAGTVSQVNARRDNEIRSGENGVSIIDTREFTLTAQVSDKDAFYVPVGDPVTGTLPDGAQIAGVLQSRSPEPDYQTGLFSVVFRFSGSARLFPGQFVTIDLPVETVRAVFLPQSLLVRRYGRFYVWTVTADNTLSMREVRTGRTHGDDIEIVEGLRPGDRYLRQRRGNEREGAPAPGTGG